VADFLTAVLTTVYDHVCMTIGFCLTPSAAMRTLLPFEKDARFSFEVAAGKTWSAESGPMRLQSSSGAGWHKQTFIA
jgi:hypothetical protein